MIQPRQRVIACVCALIGALALGPFHLRAGSQPDSQRAIFVIALENHNWEQPVNKFTGGIQQIYQNPAAPFINSLVKGTAVGISDQVAYATAYYHVLATPTGAKFSIHPSEPNYLWAEAGTNFGIRNDNDPYSPQQPVTTPPVFPNNFDTSLHLSNLLTMAGHTWKSYQEDVDVTPTGVGTANHPAMSNGGLRNVALPQSAWTVPLISFSGTFGAPDLNAYNHKNQYQLRREAQSAAVLHRYQRRQQPDQFKSVVALLRAVAAACGRSSRTIRLPTTTGSRRTSTTTCTPRFPAPTWRWMARRTPVTRPRFGRATISSSRSFPMIMQSPAYQNHGVIIIWTDETEGAGSGDTPSQNDYRHALAEIVISHDAHDSVIDPNNLPVRTPVRSCIRTPPTCERCRKYSASEPRSGMPPTRMISRTSSSQG